MLIGAFGLSQIGGGLFVADPALGFPAGTGDGSPESLSLRRRDDRPGRRVRRVHRVFTALHDTGWSRYSLGTGLAFLACGGPRAGLGDWRIVAGAIALGWSWASLVAWRLWSALE